MPPGICLGVPPFTAPGGFLFENLGFPLTGVLGKENTYRGHDLDVEKK